MKRNNRKWTAQQVLDAIKKYKLEISCEDDLWFAYGEYNQNAEECESLEEAVMECAKDVEAVIQELEEEAEKRDREEYERLKAKYEDNL